MTIEPSSPKAVYAIATAGPYALRDSGGNPWPYVAGGVQVLAIKAGVITALTAGTHYTLSPASGTDGNLTLTSGALATYTGGTLVITRATPREQGWEALLGPREAGLAAQLDRIVMGLQELDAQQASTLRMPTKTLPLADLPAGSTVVFDGTGFRAGPTEGAIENAADFALAAQAAADLAVPAAAAADLSAEAAAASAASINLPPITGKALHMLQVLADETGYRLRSPTQVVDDLGLNLSGIGKDTASTITNLNTLTVGGVYYVASGATGNPIAEPVVVQMLPADATTRAVQIIIGLTSGAVHRRVEAGGTWGAWVRLLTAGDISTSSDWATALTSLPDRATVDQRIGARLPLLARSSVQSFVGASALNFTGVSAPANRIDVNYDAASLGTADNLLVQVRVGGAAVTTGYKSSAGGVNSTAGFIIELTGAALEASGKLTLTRKPATNVWIASQGGARYNAGTAGVAGGGRVDAGGVVDGITFTRTAGTGDAGDVWIEVFQ